MTTAAFHGDLAFRHLAGARFGKPASLAAAVLLAVFLAAGAAAHAEAGQPPVAPLSAPPAASAGEAHVSEGAAAPAPAGPLAKRVIAVMWDGFAPEYLDGRAKTPTLDRLIAGGAYFPELQTVYPPITNVAFSSILTGAYPEVTGNLAYWWNRETNRTYGQSRAYRGETIVEALQRAGLKSASVGMWLLEGHGLSRYNPEALYLQPEGDFALRVDHVIALLKGEYGDVPDFVSVYAAELDTLGHNLGPQAPEIVQALEELDRGLGRIVQALEELDLLDTTAVVVLGDHGMTGYQHTIRSSLLQSLVRAGYIVQWLPTDGGSADEFTEVVGVAIGRSAAMYFKGRNQGRGQPQRPFTEEEKREVIKLFRRHPDVERVITREELDAMGAHPLAGDFFVEAVPPGSFFASSRAGVQGSHGSLREVAVPLILYGAGVRQGVAIQGGRTIDIAPTIAYLLGAPPLRDAQGSVLYGALAGDGGLASGGGAGARGPEARGLEREAGHASVQAGEVGAL